MNTQSKSLKTLKIEPPRVYRVSDDSRYSGSAPRNKKILRISVVSSQHSRVICHSPPPPTGRPAAEGQLKEAHIPQDGSVRLGREQEKDQSLQGKLVYPYQLYPPHHLRYSLFDLRRRMRRMEGPKQFHRQRYVALTCYASAIERPSIPRCDSNETHKKKSTEEHPHKLKIHTRHMPTFTQT